jgi:hypothetical protein
LRANDRRKRRIDEREIVIFNIMDTMEGDSSRGNWVGRMPGVVRPLLKWDTSYEPNLASAKTVGKS